ncbi:DUF2855 family protein [Marinobacter sp. CHS3-4]|uniref:DUF2855 family protein n=1 Tax=Marinobacter sp. CHS3-4 TaxID=3045174 RepID=UPI0024B55C39|nr:DUF2855 family protein [Marinobacter sp. CHS3-4]MDI9243956.1 DUF2855 family protein [Marinobacter sp. CHS3-4]
MPQFQVKKHQFSESRLVHNERADQQPSAGDGEIVVRIEAFSFTANNITYAAAGDQLGYWQFFPPQGEDVDGWGVIPVWGFAQVVESAHSDVQEGERLFGYFPPAAFLKILPQRVSGQRLFDGAEHRAKLPALYNSYTRVDFEPGYNQSMDDERMLLWPLHLTSFCLWDQLQDNGWYGAEQVLIVSASSKTSIGLGYALEADDSAPRAVGLTSSRNLELVCSLGIYDQCLSYDALTELNAELPTVIVDMSGSGDLLAQLQSSLGNNLRYCINVGLTHWDEFKPAAGIPKDRAEFFFAPSHIGKRMKDWGPEGFATRTAPFLSDTARKSRQWLRLRDIDGLEGLAKVYPDVCQGRIPADEGLIVRL